MKNVDPHVLQKIQLYHQTLSWQDSLLQSYRMLFIGLQTILVAFVIFLVREPASVVVPSWLMICIGWGVSAAWIFICVLRGYIIDGQKKAINERLIPRANAKDRQDLKEWYKPYEKPLLEKHPPRIFFNIILPVAFAVLWWFIAFGWLP